MLPLCCLLLVVTATTGPPHVTAGAAHALEAPDAEPGAEDVHAFVAGLCEVDLIVPEQREAALRAATKLGRSDAVQLFEAALPDREVVLPAEVRAVLVEGLSALGPRVLIGLHAQQAGDGSPDVTELSFEILEHCGTARELRWLLLEVGGNALDMKMRAAHRGLDDAEEDALSAILTRDPEATRTLDGVLPLLREDVAETAISALARSRSPLAANVLIGRLRFSTARPDVMLAGLIRLADVLKDEQVVELLELLPSHTASDRRETRQAAIQLLGRLRASTAVPLLIELLEAESDAIRENAAWALRNTSGLNLRPSAERWTAWYSEQVDWYENRLAGLVEQAWGLHSVRATSALRELATRPLFAREIRTACGELILSEHRLVREQAMRMLNDLGCAAPVVALELLEEGDGDLASTAREMLGELTGLELGSDTAAWRQALETRGFL